MLKLKCLLICLLWLSLTGCELINQQELSEQSNKPAPVEDSSPRVCVFEPSDLGVEHNCDLTYWLQFWTQEGGKGWSERKAHIAGLGETEVDLFKKILLSQGKETPYQNRLRAQNWITEITPKLTSSMSSLVKVLITESSQEKLEFESALAILTRLNSQQAKALEEQELKLKEQQLQLEQLLKIEASMVEKRGGINQ